MHPSLQALPFPRFLLARLSALGQATQCVKPLAAHFAPEPARCLLPAQAGNRPQVTDPLGRNLTPKPLALSKAELAGAAGVTKTRVAGTGAGGTLSASGVSVASDGDLGGDTQSAGGFSHSVVSDAESGSAAAEGGTRGPVLPTTAPLHACMSSLAQLSVALTLPSSAEDDDVAADAAGASGAEAQLATIEPSSRSTLGAYGSPAAAASPALPPLASLVILPPRLSRSAYLQFP